MEKYSDLLIAEAVKSSLTWAEVSRKLRGSTRTGHQSHFKKRAVKANINFDHFIGQKWAMGKEFPLRQRDVKDYLCENGVAISSHYLKKKLINLGLKENKCENCHLSKWMDDPIVLELHHLNSNHTDNRIENLQIICPNCHAQKTRISRKKVVIKKPKKKVSKLSQRKVERPSMEDLKKMISNFGVLKVSKMFGVQHNSIRKWCEHYGFSHKDFSPFSRKNTRKVSPI